MNLREIYLAGGCFWGTEAYLKQLPGVVKTETGYANSIIADPAYEDVCSGETSAAEAVKVTYDADTISLPLLLQAYMRTIDPFSLNRQGNDRGTQYRTGIYWTDPADERVVRSSLIALAQNAHQHPRIEAKPLENFYPAEEYHQDYLDKNPMGYCHVNLRDARTFVEEHADDFALVSSLAKENYRKPSESELTTTLDPQQFAVTQESATDAPYRHPFDQNFEDGIYVDIVSGEPLFSSQDKFDAGCGWPSFTKPLTESVVTRSVDTSIPNMPRVEVKSDIADSHLGHVFNDGPADQGGLRYCINGSALHFIPRDRLEEEGYGYLRDWV